LGIENIGRRDDKADRTQYHDPKHANHKYFQPRKIIKQPLIFASFKVEREFAKDNKMLGQFRLEGIPAAARGGTGKLKYH